MNSFDYLEPRTIEEAFQMKSDRPASVYLAGGTDVVPLLKYGLISPPALISLEKIPELGRITVSGDDLLIGGLVRLHQLYGYAADIPTLAGLGRAAQSVASPQIRRLGTVAGNLRQFHRCYYYNQTTMWRQGIETCLKNEGTVCHQAPAKKTCQALHYSDLAPALLAAGASVRLFGGQGTEVAPLELLLTDQSALGNGLITEIIVPEVTGLKRLLFRKRAARAAIDFPLANAALAWRGGGQVRLAIGAMSPAPFFLEETAAEIFRKLRAQEPLDEGLEEAAEKEARKKMRPIKEATVSPAVKIKAMRAVVREVLADLRFSLADE